MAVPATPPVARLKPPEMHPPGSGAPEAEGSGIIGASAPSFGYRPGRPAQTLEDRLASIENLVGIRRVN